jgi:regulator of protease activity HflC (stomatin/prohibitin superfamily)
MIGSGTLVDAIMENLSTLAPWRVVRSYERGVKFRAGLPIADLEPGWHWFVPIYETIEVVPVIQETRNVASQSSWTADGSTVVFSCAYCYEIVDARKAFTAVQDLDNSMDNFVMVWLARAVRRRTRDQLRGDARTLERRLASSLSDRAGQWGVRITWLGLTDLSDTRVIRLMGDSNTGFRLA